jgi:hypothetical protein
MPEREAPTTSECGMPVEFGHMIAYRSKQYCCATCGSVLSYEYKKVLLFHPRNECPNSKYFHVPKIELTEFPSDQLGGS